VTTYSITITADDDSATTTRLRLDTSGGQVILTDLHLHDGKGLSAGQLPGIDYGLLLRAITTTTPTPVSSPTPHVDSRDTTPAPTAVTAVTAKAPARRRPRSTAPATATNAKRGGRGSAAAAAPQPAAGGRRRAGTGNKTAAAANKSVPAARKTTTRATAGKANGATSGAASGGTGRAYRRMPDDFAAVYQQAGSAGTVAEYYQVPRHTANGWIRRLREQGLITTGR
jgi:hypothetical protein